jgi:hypothetical protein
MSPQPRVRTALALVAALVLAGCSGDPADQPAASGSTAGTTSEQASQPAASSQSPTPTPTESASSPADQSTSRSPAPDLPRDRAKAAKMHLALLGSSVADSAEEQAVVDAWLRFWQGAADSYFVGKPQPALLQSSAGDAREQILTYLQRLDDQQHRVVGWARDNIQQVSVDGNTARVRDCTENFTFSVDRSGKPVTRPTPFYDVSGDLQQRDGRWVVVAQSSSNLKRSCLG